jgi:hypothetical protein
MSQQYPIAFTFIGSPGSALAAVVKFNAGNGITLDGGKTVQLQQALPPGPPALGSLSVSSQQISLSAPPQSGQTPSLQLVVTMTASGDAITGDFPNSGTPCQLSYQVLGSSSRGEIPVGSFSIPLSSPARHRE